MGRGGILWAHPHSIDLILFFADDREVVDVQCYLHDVELIDRYCIKSDPIINFASINFNDGVSGFINQIEGCDVHLICSEGQITIHQDDEYLSVKKSSQDDPYLIKSNTQEVNSPKYEGTLSALNVLYKSKFDNNYHVSLKKTMTDIILGQKIIFGFALSHLLSNSRVDIKNLEDNLKIIDATGEFIA